MRPYETIQEVLEAAKIHGPYVKKSGERYYSITAIYRVGKAWACVLDGYRKGGLNPQEFLTECTWQDGSPCGKSIKL